jgi:UDP-N-acetylmuramyl pentapeptide phosphotransferase/UDP-N-acetylglucosamine-1-phosphate transferase
MVEMLGAKTLPNERDNHIRAIPRGAGIAVTLSIIGFLCVIGVNGGVLAALFLLLIISAIDDYKSLSPMPRLALHFVAAAIMVNKLPAQIITIIPFWAEYALLTVTLVIFMNIYNFMDGIDELTAVQTCFICIGLIMLSSLVKALPNSLAFDGFVIMSAIIGFWYFNRHPATIFLGDSGSIPVGALIGWLLMLLASKGFWIEALILPAYYIVDAGLTMLKRLAKGAKPWQAHSEHAYQIFVRSNKPHNEATKIIGFYNLIILALIGGCIYLPQFRLIILLIAYVGAFSLYLFFMSYGGSAKKNTVVNKKYISV